MKQGLYELFGLFGKKPVEPPYKTSSPARLGAAKVYTDADIASAGAKLGLSDYMTKSSYVGDVYKNITKTDANIKKAPVSPSDIGALMQFGANRYKFSTPAQALRNIQKASLKAK